MSSIWARAFDLAVLRKLDFEGMDSLQDFVAEVTASGLIPDGQAVTYDPVSHTLRVPFAFEIDLAALTLRDLDALGLVNLELLEDEGLIQIGPYVDPDNLLDHGYADLADLAAAGVLDGDSVDDWDALNADTIADAGIIGPAALAALGLVGPGGLVDLDELIDEGLVTFGELAEAGIITVGSIVANLGLHPGGQSGRHQCRRSGRQSHRPASRIWSIWTACWPAASTPPRTSWKTCLTAVF